MKAYLVVVASLLLSVMVAMPASAQGVFKNETGKAFNNVVPKDFVLEENSIPTEKRNTAVVSTPSGGRLIVGLLDTSGYSSQVQQKYLGMLISEGSLEVCGNKVSTGSYGFGLAKSGASAEHAAQFKLYDQAGEKVAECKAEWDAKVKRPRPLQVDVNGGTARLYLGRQYVGLK